MQHQLLKQCEFFVCENNLLIAAPHRPIDPVHFQIAAAKKHVGISTAPEQRFAPRVQFDKAEGLEHQIVCPMFKASNAALQILSPCQNHYRQVCIEFPHVVKSALPILLRQVQIEDGYIRALLFESFYRCHAVQNNLRTMTFRLESTLQKDS